MKNLLIGIIAILFSFNGWAEDNLRKSIMFDDAIVKIKIPQTLSNEAILGKKILSLIALNVMVKMQLGKKR